MEKELAICPVCGGKAEMITMYTACGVVRCLHFFTQPKPERSARSRVTGRRIKTPARCRSLA